MNPMIEDNITWFIEHGYTVEITPWPEHEFFVEARKGRIRCGGAGGLNKALRIAQDNAETNIEKE
jgi:hypothetical protein